MPYRPSFAKEIRLSRNTIIILALICISAVLSIPGEVLAQTSDFGGQGFREHSDKIQGFLFGPAMRLAGILGGAYGLIQAIVASTVKPLLVYGGIGLGVNIIPSFIDGVFSVSGMLLQ